MNLSFILWTIKKRKLLIGGITLLFLAVGLILSFFILQPQYEASSVLMVTGSEDVTSKKVDYMTLLANKQLVKTYSQIVTSNDVLDKVLDELIYDENVTQLRNHLTIRQVGDTELMEIRVLYSDPQKAVDIANKTASVFREHTQGLFKTSVVKLVEPAVKNNNPVSPNILFNTVISTWVGFLIALMGGLIYNHVHKPIRGREDIETLAAPYLVKISQFKGYIGERLLSNTDNNSKLKKEFYHLQTLLMEKTDTVKKLMITGTTEGEGKSTVCAGLAFCLAQTGYKVVVIDADFTNPCLHRTFKLSIDSVNLNKRRSYSLQETEQPGITIASPTKLIENTFNFINSEEFKLFMDYVTENFDIVLVDGPALLDEASTLLLATKVDAIGLVVREGTPMEKLAEVVLRLKSIKANLLGVVLNTGKIQAKKK